MTIPKDEDQLENARRLRREMTPHERKLWYLFLRKYPVKFINRGSLADLSWTFTALLPSWSLKWMERSIMNPKGKLMMLSALVSYPLMAWKFYDSPTGTLIGIFVVCAHKLILSFTKGFKTLSVTCGDSSPRGRAKAATGRSYIRTFHLPSENS